MPKFLVDESTGVRAAELLKQFGYNTYSVTEKMRGVPDQEVLNRAIQEGRIIVTNDKGLAHLALSYRPAGILLLRLADERTEVKLRIVRIVLNEYLDKIEGSMIVATERSIRIRPIRP